MPPESTLTADEIRADRFLAYYLERFPWFAAAARDSGRSDYEFVESEHPRAGDGRFAEGTGGGKSKKSKHTASDTTAHVSRIAGGEGELSGDDWDALADRLSSHTAAELKEIRAGLGVKGTGAKAELVQGIIDAAKGGMKAKRREAEYARVASMSDAEAVAHWKEAVGDQDWSVREPSSAPDAVRALKEFHHADDWMRGDVPKNDEREGVFLHFPNLKPHLQAISVRDLHHPEVRRHVLSMSRVPPRLLKAAEDAGSRWYVGGGGVPGLDNLRDLAGVRPRGWPEGKTWDVVPGVYHSQRKVVAAGTGTHGSADAFCHEFGHCLGDVLGWDHAPELDAAHRRLFDKLAPYLAQGGPGGTAGRQELLAESIAEFMAWGYDYVAKNYDAQYADWLRGKLS